MPEFCAAPIKTFELKADASFIDELDRLAKISGITKAEVIDRAIGLYAIALAEIEQGKTMQFVFHKEQADA